MEPAEALERIAYLLDRAREKSYRVRAYLRAAEVVKGLSPDELRTHVAAGTLTDFEGIGPKTTAIVAEVLGTGTTSYLAQLEEEAAVRIGGGDELRALLKGDRHMHSTWSDGGAEIDVMARAARDLGHEYIVLTDHSPRLTIASVHSKLRMERAEMTRRLLSIAVEMGCHFSIDTDAHAPGQLEWQAYGCDRAAECEVPADRIVNTWSADELLAWAAG